MGGHRKTRVQVDSCRRPAAGRLRPRRSVILRAAVVRFPSSQFRPARLQRSGPGLLGGEHRTCPPPRRLGTSHEAGDGPMTLTPVKQHVSGTQGGMHQ
jgi:hypothetical protein